MTTLGLERRARKVPTPAEYVAERYGQRAEPAPAPDVVDSSATAEAPDAAGAGRVSGAVSEVTPLAEEAAATGERALCTAAVCVACGRALTGRQRSSCAPRCRALASRRRRDAELRALLVRAQELLAAALRRLDGRA